MAYRNISTIQSGVVARADGFSYELNKHSFQLERFPPIGGVKIGNGVDANIYYDIDFDLSSKS